jgi:hypothetical protein
MRLWRNQAFVVFWSARTISFAGTGITMNVLPMLVYGMTHSPVWVASLTLIEAVPYLSFGLLAGAVAGWSFLGSRPLAAVSVSPPGAPA